MAQNTIKACNKWINAKASVSEILWPKANWIQLKCMRNGIVMFNWNFFQTKLAETRLTVCIENMLRSWSRPKLQYWMAKIWKSIGVQWPLWGTESILRTRNKSAGWIFGWKQTLHKCAWILFIYPNFSFICLFVRTHSTGMMNLFADRVYNTHITEICTNICLLSLIKNKL